MSPSSPSDRKWKPRIAIRLTLEGFVFFLFVIALLVISLIQRLNLMTLFFALSITIVLATFWLGRRNLKMLSARWTFPQEVHAGAPLSVDLEVNNARGKTAGFGLTFQARLHRQVDGVESEVVVPLPTVFAMHGLHHPLRLGELDRGVYRLQAAALTSRFPFGLVQFRLPLACDGELVVYPSLGQFEGQMAIYRSSGTDVSQRSGGQRGTQLDQYRHLRDYRIGDNPRHVHWRSSARRGQLMVKEFEPDGASPSLLLLDPFVMEKEPRLEILFEKLISLTATMCAEMGRHSSGRGILVIAGGTPVVIEGQGGRWLQQCFHQLANVNAAGESHFRGCVQMLHQNKRLLGPQIWILGLQSRDAYAAALVEEMGGEGISRQSRFQCIGESEVEKLFRWRVPPGYAETMT
jgi:uncharacterized protein (DUF58 family)